MFARFPRWDFQHDVGAMRLAFSSIAVASGWLLVVSPARGAAGLDAGRIGVAAGVEPTVTPDGVVKLGWARDDVPVAVDGVALKPFAGLGSWAALTSMPKGGAMLMGDTVVF